MNFIITKKGGEVGQKFCYYSYTFYLHLNLNKFTPPKLTDEITHSALHYSCYFISEEFKR